ncbi:SgrR family transcriptional regulator [Psychrobacillus sp. PGGUH221]|uniref:SgrR family transcriptional regulator n=1 Tax=Psychrobacillus sp. PGGUH221 TaxID=3020058 RepID=UPI0035C69720
MWQCSTRYAKTIVKKCYESEWIDWETYQGRGKKPLLKIKLPKLQAIYIAFDELWQGAHYDRAYKILHEYKLLADPEVNTWLSERFGFTQSDDELDVFRYPYPKVELNLDPIKVLSRHDSHFARQICETLF